MIKQIMIPVAAFAVTATAASAFNPDLLEKIDVDLTDGQVSALEAAHELKTEGADRAEMKAFLEDAGIDKDTMKEIHQAGHEYREEHRAEVKAAIEAEDYDAFVAATADTPNAELIDSEADFEKLVAAHELREAGDHEGAKEIMEELGFEKPEHGAGRGGMHGSHGPAGEGEGRGLRGERVGS